MTFPAIAEKSWQNYVSAVKSNKTAFSNVINNAIERGDGTLAGKGIIIIKYSKNRMIFENDINKETVIIIIQFTIKIICKNISYNLI